MKRWIWPALVFLLLGAATHAALASACAIWRPRPSVRPGARSLSPQVPQELKPILPDEWQRSPGPMYICISNDRQEQGFGWHARIADLQWVGDGIPIIAPARIRHIQSCGWPFPAFDCTGDLILVPSPGGPWTYQSLWHGGVAAPRSLGPRTFSVASVFSPFAYSVIPVHPAWPGLAADAVIWTIPWLLLLEALPRARRASRRRHHLCHTCAYPTDSSPVCTECGKPVKPRPTPTVAPVTAEPRN